MNEFYRLLNFNNCKFANTRVTFGIVFLFRIYRVPNASFRTIEIPAKTVLGTGTKFTLEPQRPFF